MFKTYFFKDLLLFWRLGSATILKKIKNTVVLKLCERDSFSAHTGKIEGKISAINTLTAAAQASEYNSQKRKKKEKKQKLF